MDVEEKRLEHAARCLGARATAHLDPDVTARKVVERLRSEPRSVPWWRIPLVGAVAATAVIVLVAGILSVGRGGATLSDWDIALAPIELQDLSLNELEEVLDTLSLESPVAELTVIGVDEMSVEQLEELLQTMMEE